MNGGISEIEASWPQLGIYPQNTNIHVNLTTKTRDVRAQRIEKGENILI